MLKKPIFYLGAVLFFNACTSNKFLHQRYTSFKSGSGGTSSQVARAEHLNPVKLTELKGGTTRNEIEGEVLVAAFPAPRTPQLPTAVTKTSVMTSVSRVTSAVKFKVITENKEIKKERKKFIFGLINSVLGLVISILLIVLVVVLILALI